MNRPTHTKIKQSHFPQTVICLYQDFNAWIFELWTADICGPKKKKKTLLSKVFSVSLNFRMINARSPLQINQSQSHAGSSQINTGL